MRKSNTVVASILVLVAALGFGENKQLRSRAEALWAKAESVSDLDGAGLAYRESATFTLYLPSGEVHGTYAREFVNADNWREALAAGEYRSLSIHKGSQTYRDENTAFTPPIITLAIAALAPVKRYWAHKESVDKIESTENASRVQAVCTESTIKRADYSEKHQACFSPDSGTLLSDSQGDEAILRSSYRTFQGRLLPDRIEVSDQERKMIEGQVEYSLQPELVPDSIKLPADFKPEPECKDQRPPGLLSYSEPAIPRHAQERHQNALVVIRIRVGTDGSVKGGTIIQSAGLDYDENAISAVRTWRFKSRTCSGLPRETNIDVEMNFRTY